jgi:hypothetical protein
MTAVWVAPGGLLIRCGLLHLKTSHPEKHLGGVAEDDSAGHPVHGAGSRWSHTLHPRCPSVPPPSLANFWNSYLSHTVVPEPRRCGTCVPQGWQ